MQIPDLVNALFECSGGFLVSLSIRKTLKDKVVRGVHWGTVAFFTSWGFWNLFYYPHLEQIYSFLGGMFVTSANLVWVILLIKYHEAA